MYELDHHKDQIMTICKLALANLAMWTVSFNVSVDKGTVSTQA